MSEFIAEWNWLLSLIAIFVGGAFCGFFWAEDYWRHKEWRRVITHIEEISSRKRDNGYMGGQ